MAKRMSADRTGSLSIPGSNPHAADAQALKPDLPSRSATEYLTNIRWVTVCIVVAYHVCYIFNGVGILGSIPGSQSLPFFDTCAAAVYPWFMVLLFLVAGMDSFYALQKYSLRQWLKSRTIKLLLPSTAGLFVWQWITGYLTLRAAGTLETIPAGIRWLVMALSGTGPLWFVQTLYLYSLVLALLKKLGWIDRLQKACGAMRFWMVLLCGLLLYAAGFIGNLPVLTMYRLGIYGMVFVLGYCVFSHLSIQDKIEKNWKELAILAAALGIIWTADFYGKAFSDLAILENPLTVAYLWFACLAVLGIFKKFFNFQTAFTRRMAADSYGIYILHYSVLYAFGYLFVQILHLSVWWQYLLLLLLVYPATLAVYEILKRIPVIRLLVLGISSGKAAGQPAKHPAA